ncbi:MAG: type IV secretion system DNA-binding domain-containing protein [Rhodocyclaceae bacterium]
MIAAFSTTALTAKNYNDGEAQGWYFHWLTSSAFVKSGWTEGRAFNGQTHGDFLAHFHARYPLAAEAFTAKTPKIFKTYPLMAGAGTLALFLGASIALGFRGRKQDDEHRRGAQVVDAKQLRKALRKEPADITLGGVPWPRRDETRHLLLAGSIGSGKTVALRQIMKSIRARGDRAIVVDAGGAFLQLFARQGDALLNPFDKRSRQWSPFAEGGKPWEIEAMARSFYPAAEGTDGVFSDLGMQVFSGLLEQCRAHGIATNHALASLCSADAETVFSVLQGHPAKGLMNSGSSDAEAIVKLAVNTLQGHPAAALMNSGASDTVGSILTNLNRGGRALRYLHPDAGEKAFSVGQWVREGEGWLFLSFPIGQREALKQIIAAQLDIVARTVLDLPADESRRVWLIVDELPLLGKISSIVEFLTNGRRFGGCAILGIQAVSQLREVYGRDGAQTMLSCLPSQLILRQPDPETAEAMSKAIGDAEVLRQNRSEGKTEHGLSKNQQEQVTNSRRVMASELVTLPDLQGYLRLIGDRPVARIKLEIPDTPDSGNPAFVPREMPARRPFALPDHLLKGKAAKSEPKPAPEPTKPADENLDWRNV